MPKPIGISASRGAAILGVSDYKTRVEAWLELMEDIEPGFCAAAGYETPVREYTAAMRWGHAAEGHIARHAGEITDREAYFAEQYPESGLQITCHIDGKYPGGHLHEGKTTTEMAYRIKWGEPGTDRIPSEYQVQVQHQMTLTGAQSCTVSVLVWPQAPATWEAAGLYPDSVPEELTPPEGITCRAIDTGRWIDVLVEMGYFHQYHVEADIVSMSAIHDAYRDFWSRYVRTRTPPPVSGYEDVRRLFREPVGTLIASPDVARWVDEYRGINDEIKPSGRLGKRKDELKTLILDWARKQDDYALDEEAQEKVIIRDGAGKKLAQFDGKTFR